MNIEFFSMKIKIYSVVKENLWLFMGHSRTFMLKTLRWLRFFRSQSGVFLFESCTSKGCVLMLARR